MIYWPIYAVLGYYPEKQTNMIPATFLLCKHRSLLGNGCSKVTKEVFFVGGQRDKQVNIEHEVSES
jgi:hypothetical protein